MTHCFLDSNKANTDLSALQAANVPCYNPIYLNDFLLNDKLHMNVAAHKVCWATDETLKLFVQFNMLVL